MQHVWAPAVALSLGAAISLGLARFSYALLLPAMRADLGWSYFTAGAMNTANAAGYFVGALLTARWLARRDARQVCVAGGIGAVVALAAHAFVRNDAALYALRALAGVTSAATFVAGGLLAARLAERAGGERAGGDHAGGDHAGGSRSAAGLVIGLYYGGTGLGIVASALVVPPLLPAPHDWPAAWLAVAAASAVATAGLAAGTRALGGGTAAPRAVRGPRPWGRLRWALAGYTLFGVGYIGYMTFIVTLLREQGLGQRTIVGFYTLLGVGVIASSWLWARLLDRYRGGQPMALLNGLLALATVLPVASSALPLVWLSGALFGAVFLSVVASTTALVRHNLPAADWPAGIAAFTIVFALGQIAGPSLVGWVADGSGGLLRGLSLSAVALALGAAAASRQRALVRG